MSSLRYSCRGFAYRTCAPGWAHDIASGAGAARYGGRFNAQGAKALYLSLDPVTAVIEGQQGFANRLQPYTMVAFDVDCSDLVDLTTASGLADAGMAPESLRCPWRRLLQDGEHVPTHVLAKRLIEEGAAGAFVPSFALDAKNSATNLVLWDWGTSPPRRAVVVDDHDRLPVYESKTL